MYCHFSGISFYSSEIFSCIHSQLFCCYCKWEISPLHIVVYLLMTLGFIMHKRFIYLAASGLGCGTQGLCCSTRASLGSTQYLWCLDLVALRHAESSWTMDRTHIPCIGRQILTIGLPGKS